MRVHFPVNFATEPVAVGGRVRRRGVVSQGAAVTVSAMTALISIHGSVDIASEASLAGLLPVVEGRLRELARRIDFNQY